MLFAPNKFQKKCRLENFPKICVTKKSRNWQFKVTFKLINILIIKRVPQGTPQLVLLLISICIIYLTFKGAGCGWRSHVLGPYVHLPVHINVHIYLHLKGLIPARPTHTARPYRSWHSRRTHPLISICIFIGHGPASPTCNVTPWKSKKPPSNTWASMESSTDL